MPRRDVVVVGASAGGIEALREMIAGLPEGFDGALFVVLHLGPGGGQMLPGILQRAGALPMKTAVDGEAIRGGQGYVCTADHHLLVGNGHVHVRRGPKENGHRPAVDPLFRSAARYYGPRTIAVVLSGTLTDGTAGLHAVRRQGGVAVVQDPGDAGYDGMPTSALEDAGADHVVAAKEIGPLLGRLARDEVAEIAPAPDDDMLQEVALMEGDVDPLGRHPGRPSQWPCPDCDGVLWEIPDADILRFRCRVGHAWSAESLIHDQSAAVEAALWVAVRSLEDRVSLGEAMARRAESSGHVQSASRYRGDLEEMVTSVEILRRLLESGDAQGVVGEQSGG
jgi:two-component system chemotaxis response regulator CheB